jgi:16S rRNA G966 N2-methylase RsmD
VYIDPPYLEATTYLFKLDVLDLVQKLRNRTNAVILVSEKEKLSENAFQLNFNTLKGGMNGVKKTKIEEWLNIF